jgi:autotransporter adhesin
VTNVADGVDASDAATVGQVQAANSQTLASANSYTDTTATKTLDSAKSYTDQRFDMLNDRFTELGRDIDRRLGRQERRLDRQGAMSSAMMNMALNAAGSRSPRGRIAVGAGWQNGQNALSIGYGKQIGERASFSFGGAFSGDDRSAGAGFGIDL